MKLLSKWGPNSISVRVPLKLSLEVIIKAFRSFLTLNAACCNLYNLGKNKMKGVVTENDIDPMPVVAIQALYGLTKEKTKLNTTEAIL